MDLTLLSPRHQYFHLNISPTEFTPSLFWRLPSSIEPTERHPPLTICKASRIDGAARASLAPGPVSWRPPKEEGGQTWASAQRKWTRTSVYGLLTWPLNPPPPPPTLILPLPLYANPLIAFSPLLAPSQSHPFPKPPTHSSSVRVSIRT